ncbi:MAG: hypothetical protein ACI4UN_01100 [Muribaculaceae bacterium]
MKQHKHLSTDIALLIFLAGVVSLIIFPILGNAALNGVELRMLSAIADGDQVGNLGNIFNSRSEIFYTAYQYLVELIGGLLPGLGDAFTVRLPGAAIVMTMTLCLFRFDGDFERLNASFLASLLFLSTTIVVEATFSASPVLLPAALFIFAMMSLYHWLHHGTRRYFWLVTFSTALATMLIGVTAPVSMAIMAYTFIAASDLRAYRRYAVITAALVASCAAAFFAIYVLTGNSATAWCIFHLQHQFASTGSIGDNMAYIFLSYVVLGIFPWSIPLLLSLPRLAGKMGRLVGIFRNLTLLQRFGVIIFVFSLPMMLFGTALSNILLLTSVFFNMPLIGKYLLLQFKHHPSVWRITGAVCASIIGLGVCGFVLVNMHATAEVAKEWLGAVGDFLTMPGGWTPWCNVLTGMIFVSLYTLWRSVREIGHNNRYLYNIITLYLLAVTLTVGYIAS